MRRLNFISKIIEGKMKRIMNISILLLSAFLLASCGSSREVQRVDTDSVIDLSGRWNDTDSRLVAEEMVDDVLKRVWLTDFMTQNSAKPVVVVGKIRNKSSEQIAVDVFAKDIERELLNSGKVRFVASAEERGEVRDERRDQQDFASADSFKKFYKELGADFLMSGVINSIEDSFEGEKVVFYQVDLQLINIETNEKVWLGNKKIKKTIGQNSYSL